MKQVTITLWGRGPVYILDDRELSVVRDYDGSVFRWASLSFREWMP